MVYGSGVGVFATSHGVQPVGDPCIDDGVAADCQLGGFLVQFADHPCGHRQRDSLLQRGMMFDYGIAEIDICPDCAQRFNDQTIGTIHIRRDHRDKLSPYLLEYQSTDLKEDQA